MLIKVKTVSNKVIKVASLNEENSIAELKEKLEESEGISSKMIRLVYQGKQLEDDKHIKDYPIAAGATLHMVVALRAGV
ncbi:Ubiquitin 2 like Rad60 SUMO like Ubiquitin family Ubiquitin like domain [Trypanosoma vivax]|uniref:Putative ubiquitin n=1 Tax=Trypanosoma vivax (strain Y486) TaxID=1055687 RepID=G0TUE5_TRYVY|nr:Ubiquitin 2 like Rad60 SUMO like Ubiquitin family Ubiquitin like domain [Trypanosoma vivax]CCC47579.1 putative ubiquitin [Trypanosoma vivax Y486]